jgi:flavin-binding protein dodecin
MAAFIDQLLDAAQRPIGRPLESAHWHAVCSARRHHFLGGWTMAASETRTSSVARITEISARSDKSFEDAIRLGIERATKTLRHVEGAWIKEHRVELKDGKIMGYQVNMLITFVLEDTM